MTIVRRWGLTWTITVAAILVIGPLLADPVLRADVFGDTFVLFLISWTPMLFAGLLSWGLVWSLGQRDRLDRRVRDAMEGHPLYRELVWQLLLIVGFVLSMVVLSGVLAFYGEATGVTPDLEMSVSLVSRLLFLFALPLLIMDRSGLTVDGKGTAMPKLSLKVREPWRWLGLIPVAAATVAIAYLIVSYIEPPEPSLTLYAMLLAFLFIAVCEEIFFRGMIQTRLEILLGRWGGIIATSVVFASTYALIQPYDAVSQLRGAGLLHDTGLAMLTYATASVLYGYLWACYRNTWINVLLRMALFVLILPPDLEVGI